MFAYLIGALFYPEVLKIFILLKNKNHRSAPL
jgi:hypothetical protein